MSANQVSCPECSRALPISNPTPGKKLRCPFCRTTFQMPAPQEQAKPEELTPASAPDWLTSSPTPPAEPPAPTFAPVAAVAASTEPTATPAVESQPQEVLPEATPFESSASPGPNRALILFSMLGGLLILAGAALGMALHFSGDDEEQQQASAEEANKSSEGKSSSASTKSKSPRRVVGKGKSHPRGYVAPPGQGGVNPPPPAVGGNPPPPPPPPPMLARSDLPPELQKQVNEAIEEGVDYLKGQQRANGTWAGSHMLGTSALSGLTLMECGVPNTDPVILRTAKYVREAAPKYRSGRGTYELSLSILFLDKLGDPADDPLIRSIAFRLIASQTAAGGWYYPLQTPFNPQEEETLLTVLERTRPRLLSDLSVVGVDGRLTGLTARRQSGSAIQEEKLTPLSRPSTVPIVRSDKLSGNQELERVYNQLPPRIRNINSMKPPKATRRFPTSDRSDNSNTQFAILGLWAAARHGVPTERALTLLVNRFRTSQGKDGGWGYKYYSGGNRGSTPPMTCAGLLGLAVGYGLTANAKKQKQQDPEIARALDYLGPYIGTTNVSYQFSQRGRVNMYYMWSLERVGVLFNLKKIAGKDWYSWGAKLLVDAQKPDGQWREGSYPGSTAFTDTSFALLFLKRANLAQDLSEKLQFVVEVKGLE